MRMLSFVPERILTHSLFYNSLTIQHPYLYKMHIRGVRWQSRKHWESIFPPRQQLHWQNLSDVTILELWTLLKAWNFQRKSWMVNCSYFRSISAHDNVATIHHPSFLHSCKQLCTCSWSSLHKACGSQGGQKGPCPPNAGICTLIPDCWADHRATDEVVGSHCCCTSPNYWKHLPFQLKLLPGDLKGQCPLYFLFFPLWEPDIKD